MLKKRFIGFYAKPACAVFILLAIAVHSSFAQDIEELKRGVVKIEATTFEKKRKIGTGFIVQAEPDAVYIVTASHVVEGASDIEVEFFSRRNRFIPADVLILEGGDPQGHRGGSTSNQGQCHA